MIREWIQSFKNQRRDQQLTDKDRDVIWAAMQALPSTDGMSPDDAQDMSRAMVFFMAGHWAAGELIVRRLDAKYCQ